MSGTPIQSTESESHLVVHFHSVAKDSVLGRPHVAQNSALDKYVK
jgi:hypothetical protein